MGDITYASGGFPLKFSNVSRFGFEVKFVCKSYVIGASLLKIENSHPLFVDID